MVFETFSRPEQWDLVNLRLKNELATNNQIRSYINPFLATHDLLISLAQLYAHKRSIAWVTGASPLLENSQPYFVRESYQIQNLKMADLLLAPDEGKSIIDGLNKDTLFLVYFKNHALSGENFPYEKIEEWANAKRIFFILVNHEFCSDFKILPSSYGIQVVDKNLTLSVLPERAKLNSPLGAYQNMYWNEQWPALFKTKSAPLESAIKSWEDSLSQSKWNYIAQRSWDRSVLFFDSVHGEIVAEKLKEKGHSNVRSYSDCVMNSPKAIRSWIQPELSETVLRGLVILSFNAPKDIPSKALLDQITNEIKTESEWTF